MENTSFRCPMLVGLPLFRCLLMNSETRGQVVELCPPLEGSFTAETKKTSITCKYLKDMFRVSKVDDSQSVFSYSFETSMSFF